MYSRRFFGEALSVGLGGCSGGLGFKDQSKGLSWLPETGFSLGGCGV